MSVSESTKTRVGIPRPGQYKWYKIVEFTDSVNITFDYEFPDDNTIRLKATRDYIPNDEGVVFVVEKQKFMTHTFEAANIEFSNFLNSEEGIKFAQGHL